MKERLLTNQRIREVSINSQYSYQKQDYTEYTSPTTVSR